MTTPRAALLVFLVSVGAYVNSVGNDFALDDVGIIRDNPAVTEPTLEGVVASPYWPGAREGSGLYRPTMIGSYAVQWRLFDGSPMGFHVVSVGMHAATSLLVLALLATFVPLFAALAGALLFAVHPVHVEAVANVVGQAEIYAAACVLAACWLYVAGEAWRGVQRGARLVAISALYAVGLGAKEIAVTLPALLVAIDVLRPSPPRVPRRLANGLPVYLSLAAIFATYLILRTAVLGTAAGEVPAPALRDLTAGERILTALSVWPEYIRLLLFPLDLASDYAPALVLTATSLSLDVLAGIVVLVGLLALAGALRRRAPLASLGIAWFCLTILPVSNLVIPAGVILAERTLYLPSAGLSIALAALVARWPGTASARELRWALALGLVVGALLTTRTVLRNPTWFDTYTVLNTLAVEHPESYLSFKSRAEGLARVGDVEGASAAYETAVGLAPAHYGLAVSAAEFYGTRGAFARAEELLRSAIAQTPDLPEAYMLLSEYLIRQSNAREGHGVALSGLANAGPDERLYALVSESYIAKGDLEAAVRARLAAVGHAPQSTRDWGRLAELYEAMGRPADARAARARADGAS
jgi:tetratricopeptide (TPR) repeat protein